MLIDIEVIENYNRPVSQHPRKTVTYKASAIQVVEMQPQLLATCLEIEGEKRSVYTAESVSSILTRMQKAGADMLRLSDNRHADSTSQRIN